MCMCPLSAGLECLPVPVMDKGALDALYAADEDAIAEDVSRMFREVQRVLRPGGV